jgi:transcriptional regulator with XRE-family HTH domain
MKLSDLRSADAVHRDDLVKDPDYRREYLEARFANQVAIQVIRWRTEHGLTQTKLAEMLGMRQPNIARLEAGEHTPSLDTLSRLASGLGINFDIAIGPADGVHLDGFHSNGEPDALAGAEIKQRAALNLDEPTYVALRQSLAALVAEFRGQQRPGGQDSGGQPVNIDAIFTDPDNGLIVFLEGFRGHHVNYLEIASDAPRPEPATASRGKEHLPLPGSASA